MNFNLRKYMNFENHIGLGFVIGTACCGMTSILTRVGTEALNDAKRVLYFIDDENVSSTVGRFLPWLKNKDFDYPLVVNAFEHFEHFTMKSLEQNYNQQDIIILDVDVKDNQIIPLDAFAKANDCLIIVRRRTVFEDRNYYEREKTKGYPEVLLSKDSMSTKHSFELKVSGKNGLYISVEEFFKIPSIGRGITNPIVTQLDDFQFAAMIKDAKKHNAITTPSTMRKAELEFGMPKFSSLFEWMTKEKRNEES